MKKLYQFSATLFHSLCALSSSRDNSTYKINFVLISSIKRRRLLLSCLVAFLVYSNSNFAQTATVPFNGAGTYTWTCPSGVTTITVQCRGGGGGGGGVATTANTPASGGGAGGSFSSTTVTVVPGTTYSVTVGAAGLGGTAAGGNGGVGGSSTFDVTSVIAVGGPGGTGSTAGAAPGGTGTTAGNTAGTNFAGGNGAAGV